MSNVTVYSREHCQNCDLLKKSLRKENIEYKTVEINTPAALTELRMSNVFTMSAPVLQIDNRFHTLEEIASRNASNPDAAMLIIDQDKVMKIIENEIRNI